MGRHEPDIMYSLYIRYYVHDMVDVIIIFPILYKKYVVSGKTGIWNQAG